MNSKQTPFLLATVALYLGFISPQWLSDGMFCDGLIYAVISNNLAHGLGSFWDLFYTPGLGSHFQGHPPLSFGLESLFFRLLGDSTLVERFYSFFTYLVTALVVVRIWKQVAVKQQFSFFWLPLLMWFAVPLTIWGISNNMLENTMMMFTSLAILLGLKSYRGNRYLNTTFSGVMIFLAVLTKGPVGLFPFAFYFWIFVFSREVTFKRFLVDISVALGALLLSFLMLFILFPESQDGLLAYYNSQIVSSLSEIQTVTNRAYIVGRMLRELIPIYVAILLVAFFARKTKWYDGRNRWVYIFFMTGLSGVMPIMISLKQSGFYILPAFPILAIAFALFVLPGIRFLIDKIDIRSRGFKFFKYFSIILMAIALVLNLIHINKMGRDEVLLRDVHQIVNEVPPESTLYVAPGLSSDWLLFGYFWRYGKIDLDTVDPQNHQYLLTKKGFYDSSLSIFKKDTIPLKEFDLYKKQ